MSLCYFVMLKPEKVNCGSQRKMKQYLFCTSLNPLDDLKGGITPEEDHEDLTTSWKIEGRSENVVKMKPFQVYKIILRP